MDPGLRRDDGHAVRLEKLFNKEKRALFNIVFSVIFCYHSGK
jgi:hypothetical protein